MSLAGSLLALIISLLRPITKKLFGYSWHYYIWLCVLLVMLMPVRFNVSPSPLPGIAPVQAEQTPVVEQPETEDNAAPADAPQSPQIIRKTALIWHGRTEVFA